MSSEYVSIKEEVLKKLEANLPEIRERFGVETIGIFGSVSRGEDTADSDIDVLYLFRENKGSMSTIIPLIDYLQNLFGRRVDLVSINYISPLIEQYVKSDAIIFGTKEAAA